jgi:hypothetical protein
MSKKILAVKIRERSHVEQVQNLMKEYGFLPSVEHRYPSSIRYLTAFIDYYEHRTSNYGSDENDPYLTYAGTKIIDSDKFLEQPALHLRYIDFDIK